MQGVSRDVDRKRDDLHAADAVLQGFEDAEEILRAHLEESDSGTGRLTMSRRLKLSDRYLFGRSTDRSANSEK